MNKKNIYKILFIFLFSLIIYSGLVPYAKADDTISSKYTVKEYSDKIKNNGKKAGFVVVVKQDGKDAVEKEFFDYDSAEGNYELDCTDLIDLDPKLGTAMMVIVFDDKINYEAKAINVRRLKDGFMAEYALTSGEPNENIANIDEIAGSFYYFPGVDVERDMYYYSYLNYYGEKTFTFYFDLWKQKESSRPLG